jgi:hypothetical protein
MNKNNATIYLIVSLFLILGGQSFFFVRTGIELSETKTELNLTRQGFESTREKFGEVRKMLSETLTNYEIALDRHTKFLTFAEGYVDATSEYIRNSLHWREDYLNQKEKCEKGLCQQ